MIARRRGQTKAAAKAQEDAMARQMKPASADTVRAWAQETGWTDEFGRPPKDRGRLNTQLVADFDKAHKRNWIEYRAGFKDDTSAQTTNSGNTRQSRSTEVATRSKSDTAPAKNTEKASTSRRKDEPIRVQAERVKGEVAQVSGSGEMATIADVMAMLNSAAAASGGKTKGMLAYYTLVG